MPKLKAKDMIALTIILAMVLFKMTGHNGTLDVAAAIVVGYYFGHRKDGTDTGH